MKNQMLFGHKIDPYFDEMRKDLEKLIAIPSICDAPAGDMPFGQACADALDYILKAADRLSLSTRNVGYYAGEAAYGDGPSYVDVLTHVDVVPAGDGWDTDPYTLTLKGNRLYGRGTADDKGAAIAALYALKALKDANVKGKRCLRVIFGCGEEIGSNDLDVYYEKQGFPVMGFTPDCTYGICNSEKGILRADFSALRSKNSAVQAFHAGVSVNAVPNQAYAEIICTEDQYSRLLELTANPSGLSVKREGSIAAICASGKAAHGAEPELGDNAASKLVRLLRQVLAPSELGHLFTFAAEKIGLEYDGTSMGLQMSDAESGSLTLNLGVVSVKEGQEIISVDIRYPVTADKEKIMAQLTKEAGQFQVSVSETNHMAPLHVPSDSLLVSTLSEAFEAVTGKECNIYSTGGGTYARHANNAVAAFGPVFADGPSANAHGPNEFLELEHFKLHCRVCLEAMYRLLTA